MAAPALRVTTALDPSTTDRDAVLARYRRLREISKAHNQALGDYVSSDALIQQARRLGLAWGKTLILDDEDQMAYVYDLALHTAPAGRSRPIDRYARSVRLAAGSDEALVLEAMRAARVTMLRIEQRHPAAGLIATDLMRGGSQVWLVDIGMEASMPDGEVLATRLLSADSFAMTVSVAVPFNLEILSELRDALPRHLAERDVASLADDRRFAEVIYRVALADGITDRVRFKDPHNDP